MINTPGGLDPRAEDRRVRTMATYLDMAMGMVVTLQRSVPDMNPISEYHEIGDLAREAYGSLYKAERLLERLQDYGPHKPWPSRYPDAGPCCMVCEQTLIALSPGLYTCERCAKKVDPTPEEEEED